MKKTKVNYILLLLGIMFLFNGCIGVNSEFKKIRSLVLDNLDDDFDRQIEFSVGPVGFFMASQFVKFANTEEGIDEILANVKKVQIGIYDRLSNFSTPSLSLLKSISNNIIDENWQSIVRTLDGNEMVGIFVKNQFEDEIEEIFIVSLTRDELVLVKLHGKLGSIIEIIIREHGQNLRMVDNSF